MMKPENRLLCLLEMIRRDSGINNAIDAVEQLSLILVLKYLHDSLLGNTLDSKNSLKFSELFYSSGDSRKSEINFYALSSLLENVAKKTDNQAPDVHRTEVIRDSVRKADSLLKQIPFKIRSEKILSVLLSKLEEIDVAGINADDYDDLIRCMVNESSFSGAFYTPNAIVRALSKVIDPVFGQTIYDPALGTGGFIVEAQKMLSTSSDERISDDSFFYGKDTSPFACLVSSLKLLLNGFNINSVSVGDSLIDVDHSTYDVILTSPPFGKISNTAKYQYEYDGYAPSLELMFLKLSMKKLKKGGKAAIVVPEGVLFNRSNQHVEIKRELLTKFNLHTILSLPSNTLSPYIGVKISVLFFDNSEPGNAIWFYQLATDKPYSKIRQIMDQDLAEFVELFRSKPDGENSYVVSRQEILDTDDLNLSFKHPNKVDARSDFNKSDAVTLLNDKNDDFGVLLSSFTGLIAKEKNAKFVETVAIGNILKTRSGQNLNRSEVEDQGGIPVYGANGIIGYSQNSNRDGENILIGRVGAHCGNIHYTTGPIWLTDNSFSVELNSPGKVYMPYLTHVLRSLDLNKLARGSAQPSIAFSKIKDIEIRLPSYEDQVELAKWFEDLRRLESSLRESLQGQSTLLSQLAESSIVGNCVPV